jgi:hypothetical protein
LFFYGYTGITPAMAMRLPGIGSAYLIATVHSNKQYFDGAKSGGSAFGGCAVTRVLDLARRREVSDNQSVGKF